MENNTENSTTIIPKSCEVCHQPVLSSYYFCPNCGTKLNSGPLSTSFLTQFSLYVFSLVLPWILFIYIKRWKGIKYLRSKEPKAKIVGIIACILLILSILAAVWLIWLTWVEVTAFSVYINGFIEKTVNDLTNTNYIF